MPPPASLDYHIELPVGHSVVKWLFLSGVSVVEGQEIASLSSGAPLHAPISGRFYLCASGTSMTSTTSSSVVQNAPHIKYCTHARQLRVGDHPICTVCGAEMNSLPPRTRELYMRAHTVNGGVGGGGGNEGGVARGERGER
jgi:hypothetical protein